MGVERRFSVCGSDRLTLEAPAACWSGWLSNEASAGQNRVAVWLERGLTNFIGSALRGDPTVELGGIFMSVAIESAAGLGRLLARSWSPLAIVSSMSRRHSLLEDSTGEFEVRDADGWRSVRKCRRGFAGEFRDVSSAPCRPDDSPNTTSVTRGSRYLSSWHHRRGIATWLGPESSATPARAS